MKLAICSLAVGDKYKDTVKLCTVSLKKYCAKHNYTLITDETLADHKRDYMWSKVPLIREQLPNYDYIVWIDGDITIMNDEIKLEHFIELYLGNKDTMMAVDVGNQINTGFWVLKNTPYMIRLLDLIFTLPELAGNYHEQGVFNRLYEKDLYDLRKHSRIIPEIEQRLFNANMSIYVIGDFLLHFLGIRNNNHLKKAITDHYPVKYDGEEEWLHSNRMVWMEKNYRKNQNTRYIRSPPKVKIKVCTFYTGDKYSDDVVKYGQKTIINYCDKHNYPFYVEKEQLVPNLLAHWTKIALLLKMMKETDDDYVVWLDADIMIMNQDIKIESIIEEYMDGKDFLLCRDVSGHINTGVFIIRNTEYSKSVLELNLKLPELRYRGYEDQDVFNQIYDRNILNLKDHSVILSANKQNVMNCCVGCYNWGTWLIHFFSLSKHGLKKAFNDYYPNLKDGEVLPQFEHRLNWLKQH